MRTCGASAYEGIVAIDIIDPQQQGRQHVDSYWAATAGSEVKNTPSVTADMDRLLTHQSMASTRLRISPLLKQPMPILPLSILPLSILRGPALHGVSQRMMYQADGIQGRLP